MKLYKYKCSCNFSSIILCQLNNETKCSSCNKLVTLEEYKINIKSSIISFCKNLFNQELSIYSWALYIFSLIMSFSVMQHFQDIRFWIGAIVMLFCSTIISIELIKKFRGKK